MTFGFTPPVFDRDVVASAMLNTVILLVHDTTEVTGTVRETIHPADREVTAHGDRISEMYGILERHVTDRATANSLAQELNGLLQRPQPRTVEYLTREASPLAGQAIDLTKTSFGDMSGPEDGHVPGTYRMRITIETGNYVVIADCEAFCGYTYRNEEPVKAATNKAAQPRRWIEVKTVHTDITIDGMPLAARSTSFRSGRPAPLYVPSAYARKAS